MAAGPKEERINLLQEQEDLVEEIELDGLRSGGRLPPKVSSLGLCFSGSSYSLKTKISTCANVVAKQRRSKYCMVDMYGQTLAEEFLGATVMRRKQVPSSNKLII